jgi:hypothetical protein
VTCNDQLDHSHNVIFIYCFVYSWRYRSFIFSSLIAGVMLSSTNTVILGLSIRLTVTKLTLRNWLSENYRNLSEFWRQTAEQLFYDRFRGVFGAESIYSYFAKILIWHKHYSSGRSLYYFCHHKYIAILWREWTAISNYIQRFRKDTNMISVIQILNHISKIHAGILQYRFWTTSVIQRIDHYCLH